VTAGGGARGWYPTSGPHFLVPPSAIDGDRAELTGDDARHLAVVLRAGPGAPVSLADGTGSLLQTRVTHAAPDRVGLAVTERRDVPAPRPSLTVVQALPKGRKLDEVVMRLTEVGVDRLVPVHSARSQVRLDAAKAAKALARWRAVAHAAAKQSRRVRPLEVAEVGEWATAFPAADEGGRPPAGAVLWEEGGAPLRSLVEAAGDVDALVLAIGPEGGLTREEVRVTGLPAATLGETILRTETAALVAASVVLGLTGRLG
jgi:16S rRNA (uracil1498-N3)-methyltransferase